MMNSLVRVDRLWRRARDWAMQLLRCVVALALAPAAAALTLPALPRLDAPAALKESHSFSDQQNWLVPGAVLLGRYPGSGRGQWAEKAVRAMRGGAGVTTFVCLQSELPPQDGGGEMPSGFEPYAAHARACAGPPPDFVHFGIPDMCAAEDLGELGKCVDDLAARVKRGETLFVHCWGGKGRTGLVAACLLGSLYASVGPEEALDRVQAYVELRAPGVRSPETDPQRDQVRDHFALRWPGRAG